MIFNKAQHIASQDQRDTITRYAAQNHLKISKFIFYNDKPDITLLKSGDTVIFFAWHCICGKRAFLPSLIQYFLKQNINIYSATSKYCVDGSIDFTELEYAFNLFEDISFSFVSAKNLAVAKQRVANGYAPGRPKGSRNQRHALDGKENKVLKMYSSGISMYAIAKKFKVSAPTIKRFLSKQS